MKLYLTIGCLLLLSACAIRKEKKREQQLSVLQIDGVSRQQLAWQHYAWYNDSTLSMVELSIEPKGYFSYSLDKGFTGEAKNIVVKENTLKKQRGEIETQAKKDELSQLNYNAKESKLLTDKQVSQKYQSIWMIIVVILILFLVCLYWPSLRKLLKNGAAN